MSASGEDQKTLELAKQCLAVENARRSGIQEIEHTPNIPDVDDSDVQFTPEELAEAKRRVEEKKQKRQKIKEEEKNEPADSK